MSCVLCIAASISLIHIFFLKFLHLALQLCVSSLSLSVHEFIIIDTFSPHCCYSRIISLRPESNPWALGQRSVFVLMCEFQQPPVSCVCPMASCTLLVSVCPCVCVWGHAVLSLVLNSTWHVLEAHSDVKMHQHAQGATLKSFPHPVNSL